MHPHVGIIHGGVGSGYDESLCSGARVRTALAETLEKNQWQPHDIFIDREGTWHRDGIARSPERSLRLLNVVINALHGEGGEDGALARILESFGVAHTGTMASSAAALADRGCARALAEQCGVHIPRAYVIRVGKDGDIPAHPLFDTICLPALVRPKDSTLVTPVFAGDTASLETALRQVLLYSPTTAALVEEYIPGTHLGVGVLEHFRDEALYVFPSVELTPAGALLCPARVERATKEAVLSAARTLFHAFGLRHYALFDFVALARDVFFLDVRTLPAFHEDACFCRALDAVGVTLGGFLEHVISLALSQRRA